MTEEAHDNDPELDGLLAAAGKGGLELNSDDLDAMYGAVEERVSAANRPLDWIRSRSTIVRRSLALGSFAVIFGVIALKMPVEDWSHLAEAQVVMACGALLVLLIASLMVAVRPLHVPELPRWQVQGLAAASVLATFILAATVVVPGIPGGAAHGHGSFWSEATPCMYFGLLVGIPVYGMARLVDRGAFLGSLLAAAAAGLTGNFFLQMRCPISDPLHAVAGHASVALIFVGGILLIETFLNRRRS